MAKATVLVKKNFGYDNYEGFSQHPYNFTPHHFDTEDEARKFFEEGKDHLHEHFGTEQAHIKEKWLLILTVWVDGTVDAASIETAYYNY